MRWLNLMCALAVVLLLASCFPLGACTGLDQSRPIAMAPAAAMDVPGLEQFDSATAYYVTQDLNGPAIIVGYYHNPSCYSPATHESDIMAYYAQPQEYGYPPREPELTISGDTVTVTQHITGDVNSGTLTVVGTFSLAQAQAALDQQFVRNKPAKEFTVPEDQLLRVPVEWHATGTVEGKAVDVSYAGQYIVRH